MQLTVELSNSASNKKHTIQGVFYYSRAGFFVDFIACFLQNFHIIYCVKFWF